MQTKRLTKEAAAEDPRQHAVAPRTPNVRHRVILKERGLDMEGAIYAKSGLPVGFHDGKIIYDLQGQPIGQLRGAQVYCMGGHYFGDLKNGVILNKKLNRVQSASRGTRGNPSVGNHRLQRIRKISGSNK